MTDIKCVVDDARAANGMIVCRPCAATVKKQLTELPMLWQQLIIAHTSSGLAEKVSGTPALSIPYRDGVGNERHRIVDGLAYWAATVAEHSRLKAPADIDPANTAGYLLAHHRWIVSWAGVRQLAEMLAARTSAARELLYPVGERTFTIAMPNGRPARCLDCGGQLVAVIRNTDDLLPSAITCRACQLDVPASSWLSWARQTARTRDVSTGVMR